MSTKSAPLRFGAPVKFRDRWQGRVFSIDVDEEWEVLNVVVRRGLGRWGTSVKLPFSASPIWSDDRISFDCTSTQAFGREVPPIAAPARPLSTSTPVSLPGVTAAGVLVEASSRRASEVLLSRIGGRMLRVPVHDVSFEAKTLRIAAQTESLRPYLTDDELLWRVREMLALDGALTSEERNSLTVDVSAGSVTIRGNVRTRQTRGRIAGLVAGLRGAITSSTEIVDDLAVEQEIGQALARSRLPHELGIYARSALGEVTLFGYIPTPAAAEEVTRLVSRVPGVRAVRSRIVVGVSPQPA